MSAQPPMNDVMSAYLHPNDVSSSFMHSFVDLLGHDLSTSRRLGQMVKVKTGSLGIPEGRNDCCKALLKSECEWLWMVDADMGFEPYALDMMLSCADPIERPIIGGLCFAQRESVDDGFNGMRCFPNPTILDWKENESLGIKQFMGRTHYPVNTLLKCGATGGAMLLIHRSVIQKVVDQYGERWFDRVQDNSGAWQGEDISFFTRTQSLEIPLYVHTGIRTTHFKHLWLSETDFWSSFVAPPATERCDVIIPVLHRPQNIEPLMVSLKASTGLATGWFVCEEDDEEQISAVIEHGGNPITFPDCHTFAEKVNAAFTWLADQEPAPWVLLAGDDVRFRPGWLDHGQDVHRRYKANVVGTNDLANARVMRGEHATHPMIRRSYIDEEGASWDGPGVVCHEGYRHWFVDDEIVTVAKQRGTFQAALGSQVEHLHPIAGKAEMDDVYELGTKHAKQDEELFARRARAQLSVV